MNPYDKVFRLLLYNNHTEWQKLHSAPCLLLSAPSICLLWASVLWDKSSSECLVETSKTFWKATTVINSVSGFPAESPETLEPSSQFHESLHSWSKNHDLSHSELEWILKPPNYWINIRKNLSQLQKNLVKNKLFFSMSCVAHKGNHNKKKNCIFSHFGLFEVKYFW